MKTVANIRARQVAKRLARAEYFYSNQRFCDAYFERRIHQLWSSWRSVLGERLPASPPSSLGEFFRDVPLLSRATFREVATSVQGEAYRSTGGSSGEPVRFPVSSAEIALQSDSVWLIRSWLQVTPADRLAMLWGHSHLLGGGLRGLLARLQRQSKDWLAGYARFSAYDLSGRALERTLNRMLRFGPDYVLGYSAALDRLARHAQHRHARWTRRLKAVIASGERFPHGDSREVLRAVFNCPVLMEYGSVEVGSIAQELAENDYRVLWGTNLLECLGDGELVVTTLYPRAVPLVRYRLGDRLAVPQPPATPLRRMGMVAGRLNKSIKLRDGAIVHSEAVAHCVRDATTIEAYQLVIPKEANAYLRYVARSQLSSTELTTLRARFGKACPSLSEIRAQRVGDLNKTVSGKVLQVVYEDAE